MKNSILVILLLFSYSCSNKDQEQFWFLEKDQDFPRVKNIFEKHVDFFPEKDKVDWTISTWSLNPDVEYNLKVAFGLDNESFKIEKERLTQLSIATYYADNDSLLVLNRFSTHENYGYPDKSEIKPELIAQDWVNDYLPVPNFWNFSRYQTNNTVSRLPNDFKIYVFEAKPGIHIDKQRLVKGGYMPEKWKHGYSKGVAISEERREIIYWVIIW